MKDKLFQGIALALTLMLLLTRNGLDSVQGAASSASKIETVDCSSFTDSGLSTSGWQCGYLRVPENRQNPQSRTIKVAFAILKATGANSLPDPIVYLTGGPGAAGIDSSWSDWATPSLKNRDLILVDPRGVGYSQPAMHCPPEVTPDASTQPRAPTPQEQVAQTLQWGQSCHDLLISQGFDLTAYNSISNANDLDDLRQALGYSQWNLYGVSYGTKTALVTMQNYSGGIRSVVLDSVMPLYVDRIGSDVITTANSFSALFAACKADPDCNRDYPDLETKFKEIVHRLDQEPLKITVAGTTKQVWVTGGGAVSGLESIMKFGYLLRLAPLAITRIHAGDRDLLGKLYANVSSTDDPAYYSTVLCNDLGSQFDMQAFSSELEKHPELKSRYATYTDALICPIWGVTPGDEPVNTAVQSDIPTLIMNAGDFDSSTSPAFAEEVASTLSHSYLYIFQKYTHAVSFEECPKSMLADFINEPSRAPNASCIAQMDGLPFITDIYPNKGAFSIFLIAQAPKSPASMAIALLGLIFLLGFVLLPIVYFRSKGQAYQTLPQIARLTLWLASTLSLIFMAGAWMLSKKSLAETYGWGTLVGFSPSSSRYLFVLPWLTTLLAVVLLVFTVLAWKSQWWKRTETLLFNLGTLAALSLTGILLYMKVISV